MTFSTLAVISLIGLLGPMLTLRKSWPIPIVLGELLAGVVFGNSGFGFLRPSSEAFTFLADIGFVLIMFVVGTHVPVRAPLIRSALRIGAARAALVGLLATAGGIGIAYATDTGHPALFAVLLASSSAAFVLPLLDSIQLKGTSALQLTAQVAISDTVCIVALPLAIDPGNAVRASFGVLVVAVSGVLLFLLLRAIDRSGVQHRVHTTSKEHKLALELRVSLAIIFALAALATALHVSIMLAGFAAGLAVAAVGEPRRLAKQLFAVTEGFFGPLFFVWLGATIDLHELWQHPRFIVLGVALGVGSVLVHSLMRLTGQPTPFGAIASAQLGLPVAAATIGAQQHLLASGEPAALLLGALITIGAATVGGSIAVHRAPAPPDYKMGDGA